MELAQECCGCTRPRPTAAGEVEDQRYTEWSTWWETGAMWRGNRGAWETVDR